MTSTIDHTVTAPADHEVVHRPPAVSLRALTKRYGDRVAVVVRAPPSTRLSSGDRWAPSG